MDLDRRAGPGRAAGWAGRPLLTLGTMIDISERKHTELLLQSQHEFSGLLVARPDRKTLLEAILDCALRLPELDGGGLYWREPDGGYRLVVQRGFSDAFFAEVERLASDSPQAEIVRQGRLQCSCRDASAHCTDPSLGSPAICMMPRPRASTLPTTYQRLSMKIGHEPSYRLQHYPISIGPYLNKPPPRSSPKYPERG